jgi:hypothetical protein
MQIREMRLLHLAFLDRWAKLPYFEGFFSDCCSSVSGLAFRRRMIIRNLLQKERRRVSQAEYPSSSDLSDTMGASL